MQNRRMASVAVRERKTILDGVKEVARGQIMEVCGPQEFRFFNNSFIEI